MKKAAPSPLVTVTAAVEGIVDEAVAQRLVSHVGGSLGPVYGKSGKDRLRHSLRGYNSAARFAPWFVLIDLNSDAACAPRLRSMLLPAQASGMRLRIAVREIEAWLLADRERFSRFFAVPATAIPLAPEAEADPKRKLVELAAESKSREIRADLIPRPGSGRREGSGYAARLIEFVIDENRGWRPEAAALRADSLRRCLAALRTLIGAKAGID